MDFELLDEMIDILSGSNNLENARQDYKNTKKIMLIMTIVLMLICIGVMYLRFRIF